jgi:CBS domain-containing protein
MTVGRICQREVDTAEPAETIRIAAQRMASRAVGALVVLDAHRKPVGILTDRDVAVRVAAEGRDVHLVTVGEVMTRSPRTIVESEPIEDALERMRTHAVRRLPVVSGRGELVGIVALDDILALLSEEMAKMGKIVEKSSPYALARS